MQPDASDPGHFSARFLKALMPAEVTTLQLKQKYSPDHNQHTRTLELSSLPEAQMSHAFGICTYMNIYVYIHMYMDR